MEILVPQWIKNLVLLLQHPSLPLWHGFGSLAPELHMLRGGQKRKEKKIWFIGFWYLNSYIPQFTENKKGK